MFQKTKKLSELSNWSYQKKLIYILVDYQSFDNLDNIGLYAESGKRLQSENLPKNLRGYILLAIISKKIFLLMIWCHSKIRIPTYLENIVSIRSKEIISTMEQQVKSTALVTGQSIPEIQFTNTQWENLQKRAQSKNWRWKYGKVRIVRDEC